MNETSGATKYEWPRYYVRINSIIIFIFGKDTKASFKFKNYLFYFNIFLICFCGKLKTSRAFFFKRFFLAIVYGFKELESIGAFFWLHKFLPFGWGDWFSPKRHYARHPDIFYANVSGNRRERVSAKRPC